MKRNTILLPLFASLLLSISACGPSQAEYEAERERADSIQRIAEIQRLDLMEITSFVDDVNQSLDSISQQEMELVFARTNSDGVALSRYEVMSNLSKFQMMLQRQHARILSLQDSLYNLSLSANASKSQVLKLTKMITYLNKQLEEKEAEVTSLKAEIASNKRDIADLQRNVADLNQNVADLESANQALTEATSEQEKMLNKGYYIIDSHKNLVDKGIVSKRNILRGSKMKLDNIDKSLFNSIDIRNQTTFNINGRKPKILTSHPESSYQITPNSDKTSTLKIINPSSFWGTMPYLIIETD